MSAPVRNPERSLAAATTPDAQALVGRDADLHELVAATEDSSTPVVLLTGDAGSGRSSTLAALDRELRAQGVSTIVLGVTRLDAHRPYGVIGRINLHLGEIGDTNIAIAQLLTARPTVPERLAVALADALQDRGRAALLIDNAQWTDPSSRELMVPLARLLAGSSVTVVCAVRSRPYAAPSGGGDPNAALRSGLPHVATVHLGPLTIAQSATLLAAHLEAHPSPDLVDTIAQLGGRLPGAMLAALEGCHRSGAVRVVDGYAHLAVAGAAPVLPRDHPVLDDVMRLPPQARDLLIALSVLQPLGKHALPLLAECTGQPVDDVRQVLEDSVRSGLLARHPTGGWAFWLPLLPMALTHHLGPYARRRTAQAAVTSIWNGTVATDTPTFLYDQLAVAGPLVNQSRAGAELLKHGSPLIDSDPVRAERWLATAVALSQGDAHMDAMLKHSRVCWVLGQWTRARDSITTLLDAYGDWLPPQAAQEAQFIYITSLRALGDEKSLQRIVSDTWRSLGGGPAQQLITTALALHCLGRFAESLDLLEMTGTTWRAASGTTARLGHFVMTASKYIIGRCDTEGFLRSCEDWPSTDSEEQQEAATRLAAMAEYLLAVDELNATRKLLGSPDGDLTSLKGAWQVMVSFLEGRWGTDLDFARGQVAVGSAPAPMMGFEGMHRALARINLARAKPASARALIEKARSEPPASGYLVNCVEADLETMLGNREGAVSMLREGLGMAADRDMVLGTDELWVRLAELWATGSADVDPDECVRETCRIAKTIGGGPTQLNHVLTRLAVHRQPDDAKEALSLARALNQPFTLANTMSRLANYRMASADLVYEAYDIYGRLGALLERAGLRRSMRELKIPVPGRQETVAEQQLVLATLVTEGLSNREMAAILHDSEKSVEGRLSRLFRQTGYRSRVELAAAVLTGTFSPEQPA